ncbi:hypothetical protein COW53_00710 [bacterium CG17_big_fil_post_rev_8_21_14_2_50_64_8]|nr:MAG: hypothetical protein COW53_00710 [bacterium CG17_big_fil_post_rev_8_21_14_2_50_64_8]PJA74270.1 MAG: hypothetical protein CO151_10240 [bacterium CG_4_9_14_3_um_filter_65_15]
MRLLDAFIMSFGAIIRNKLRSVLTLVGIVAGVASIIAVMTAISVVHSTMEKEMSVLGAQVFQVQKWPAGFNSDRERCRAMRRPPLTVENADMIRQQVANCGAGGSRNLGLRPFGGVPGGIDQPEQFDLRRHTRYPANNTHYVGEGRNISQIDVKNHHKVCVIGFAIGQELFPFADPIGKDVRVEGRKYREIGVFDKKNSAFGGGFDQYILIPVTTFLDTYGMIGQGGFEWAVIGLVFSSAVGISFGLLPAIRASRLNPVDALSYE